MPGPERLLHLIALYAHEAKHYLIALIPSAIPVCFYIFWKVGVKKAALAPAELEELNSSASQIGRSVFKKYWPLAILLPAASLFFMLCDLNDDTAWRHSLACDIIGQLNLPVQGMLVASWLSLIYKAWATSRGQNAQVAIDKLIVLGFSIAFSRLLFGYALNIGPFYTQLYLLIALYPALLLSRHDNPLAALAQSVSYGQRHILELAVLIGRISCLFWFIQFILGSLVAYFANLAQFLPSRFPIDILPYSGFVLQTCGQISSLVYDSFVLLNCLEYWQKRSEQLSLSAGTISKQEI